MPSIVMAQVSFKVIRQIVNILLPLNDVAIDLISAVEVYFFGCLILCGIVEQFKDLFYCALYSQSIGKCWIACRSYFRIHFEVHSTQPQRAIEGGNFSFVTFVQTTPNHREREEEKTSRLRPVLAVDRCEGGYPKRHYFVVKKFSIATWTKMGRRLMLFFVFFWLLSYQSPVV